MKTKRNTVIIVGLGVIIFTIFCLVRREQIKNPDENTTRKTFKSSDQKTVYNSNSNSRTGDSLPYVKNEETFNTNVLLKYDKVKIAKMSDEQFQNFVIEFMKDLYDNTALSGKIFDCVKEQCPAAKISAIYSAYGMIMANQDFDAAIGWMNSIEDSAIRNNVLKSISSDEARSGNASKALSCLVDHTKKEAFASSILMALSRYVIEEPDKAIAWVGDNLRENPDLYYSGMSTILAHLGAANPDDLRLLLRRYDLGVDSNRILLDAIGGMASINYASALRFVDESDVVGKDRDNILSVLFSSDKFQTNVDASLKLLDKDDAKDSYKILSPPISSWLKNDVETCLNWLNSQTDEVKNSILFNGALTTLGSVDPTKAINIIESSNYDQDERISAYKSVLISWSYSSPEKSLNWISKYDSRFQDDLLNTWLYSNNRLTSDEVVSLIRGKSGISDKIKEYILKRYQP